VEKAPAKPAKTKATLKLNSTPPGAEIVVDGKAADKSTPDTVTIDRGQHTIALRLEGFQEASAKFKVSGGEEFEFSPELVPVVPGIRMPRIVIPNVPGMNGPSPAQMQNLDRLKNLPGISDEQRAEIRMWEKWSEVQKSGTPNILVNSHPRGARIIVDGKDSGQRTPEILPATNGQHIVRLELQGYESVERKVTVGGRGPAMVNARMKPTAPKPPSTPDQP